MTQLMSKRDAARALGISIETLHRIIARGDLTAFKVGGQVRISPEQIATYLRDHTISRKDVGK